MYVRLLTNFLSEKAVGKSESKDVHLAVLRVLPEVIRESVDAEQHADYRKGEDGNRGGNGVNPDVTMHILYGAVTIDGKTYRRSNATHEMRNLLAAMGRTASSCPNQQSTSTTRCRTQTVDSPFGNSSNPIFTEAYQAVTYMVARHYIRIRITPFKSTIIPNSRC